MDLKFRQKRRFGFGLELPAWLIFVVSLAFFGVFLIYPVTSLLKEAFTDGNGDFTMNHIYLVFTDPLYLEGLWNSLKMAIFSTLLAILLGLPLAVLASKYSFHGKAILTSLILIPLILPPFVGAIGVKSILGTDGSLNNFLIWLGFMERAEPFDWLGNSRLLGVVVMNALHLFPIIYLNTSAALANLDPSMEEAAENLGCSPGKRFFRITLPLITPGLFAGGTIVFIWSFTELGVPLIFDYGRVTSVQIFDGLKDLSGDFRIPYALVFLLLLFSVLFFFLSKLLFGRGYSMAGGRATTGRETKRLGTFPSLVVAAVFCVVIFVSVLPHIGVVLVAFSTDWYGSVLPQSFTSQHFNDALGHSLTVPSIANSLKYASLSTLLDVFLGVAIAYVIVRSRIPVRGLLDILSMLPLAVPGLVMAFGYMAMSASDGPFSWLRPGEDPMLLLVLAYAVRRLPYVVRAAVAGFQQTSPVLEEAARNLGASPLSALRRITLPLIAANLVAGALLAFSFAMLEVSDSLILADQDTFYPITKAIFELSKTLGNGSQLASALGVWGMLFLGVTIIGASVFLGKKLGALFRV